MYELGKIAIIGLIINFLSIGIVLFLYLREKRNDDRRFNFDEEYIVEHDKRLDSIEELQTEFIDILDEVGKKAASHAPAVIRDNHRKRKPVKKIKTEVKDGNTD
jgi:hypothetical protein